MTKLLKIRFVKFERALVMQILEQINQRGITVIVSTHDYTLVDRFRKRVLTLEKGEIVRDIQAGTYGQ